MRNKQLFLFILAVFLLIMFVDAGRAEELSEAPTKNLDLIDVPTADSLDHYGYYTGFRFGTEGALYNKSTFGIFPRLNLGFGLSGENVIGTGSGRINNPTMNLRFRLFDGKNWFPAIGIGWDGQGYKFNDDSDEYEQREMGAYAVVTGEMFFEGLRYNFGVNAYDFEESNPARGFVAASYEWQKTFGLMAEWVNATEYKERRINGAVRYFVTPFFTVDFNLRDVPKEPRSESRVTERVVRIGYTGSF